MRDGWQIYAKSGVLLLTVCLAPLTIEYLLRPLVQAPPLRAAIAISLFAFLTTFLLAAGLLLKRFYGRFQKSLQAELRPAVEERVMALAFSGNNWSTPVPKQGATRAVLEQCIAHALHSLKESPRGHVAKFALEQGFAERWQKVAQSGSLAERKQAISCLAMLALPDKQIIQAALQDPDSEIRIEAARALLATGDGATVEQVFRFVLGESLLVRVLLTIDLKRHARLLLVHSVPGILAENDRRESANCLALLLSWRLAVPSLDATRLLQQQGCCSLSLPLVTALLPYVSVDESIEDHLRLALASADTDVQCAAARAIGQLRLYDLIPDLSPLLKRQARLASESARALAQMGTAGIQHLERAVREADRRAAAAALEALEHLAVRA